MIRRYIYVVYKKGDLGHVLAAGDDEELLAEHVMEVYGYDVDSEDSPYVIELRSVHYQSALAFFREG